MEWGLFLVWTPTFCINKYWLPWYECKFDKETWKSLINYSFNVFSASVTQVAVSNTEKQIDGILVSSTLVYNTDCRTSKLIDCQLQRFHVTSSVLFPKVSTPGLMWSPKSLFSSKKSERNFLFLITPIGLKIMIIKKRLKANPIYLIFKSYHSGEGGGKGGSWLWNVWKCLAMLALGGSVTRLPLSTHPAHAIVISKYKLCSSKYACINCQHC